MNIMTKLTKSLLVIKERNCTASLVLDTRTNRRNVTEYPLAMRFTIDRKIFYHILSGSYSEKRFSDICNAAKSMSDNYREQKMWRETYVVKYKLLLQNLNKGGNLTFEMVRSAVANGNDTSVTEEKTSTSFFEIWETIIHELKTNDNGTRFTTSESYECALKSFRKIMGNDSIKGFNISAAEIQKWKDGMHNGIIGKDGKLIGKISDTTAGIYLRACRAVWNRCIREGYLTDIQYPFSNKKEKGLVSIPKSAKRRQSYLNIEQMTELYNLFLSKSYPSYWSDEYKERAHYSLGLFLVGYWEKPKVRKIQFPNFPSKFSILFQYIFYYIPLFCIKWLYYSKPARQFSLIVAVCIWFFSLCFTGFLLYDNAKLSLENEKNMLIRKTLGTDKKNRKQIMYIDLLYSHKEYYEDEILRLLEKSINDN